MTSHRGKRRSLRPHFRLASCPSTLLHTGPSLRTVKQMKHVRNVFLFPSKHSQPDSVLIFGTSPFLSEDEPVTSDWEVEPQPMEWNKVTTYITEAILAHAFTSSVWVLVDPFCKKNALPITFALCFFMWRWDYSLFLIIQKGKYGTHRQTKQLL